MLTTAVKCFRVVFTECTVETCPCGEQCSNQRIQRHEFAPALEKFVTDDRGFGVRTLKPIVSGKKTVLLYYKQIRFFKWVASSAKFINL